MRDTSLVYPMRDGKFLLGRKKRGMGFGKWNGFGGKIEDGETMRECAARELFEESGLLAKPKSFILAADLYFHQSSDPRWSHAGIVYLAPDFEGIVKETDEMQPRWFTKETLPYDNMWMADKVWLPLVLAGEKIRGIIYFDSDGETVYDYDFKRME